jgi:hypothetical protein
MKIPAGARVSSEFMNEWERAAARIAIETGVFVEVGQDIGTSDFDKYDRLARIYFILDGHQFETLPELKKAIANKAFL